MSRSLDSPVGSPPFDLSANRRLCLFDCVEDPLFRAVVVEDADEARAMLAETAALTLLRGHRGAPPADIDAAVHAIVALSQLGASLGSTVSAIEVNPLIVHASGAFGVDALCVAGPPG